jgi:glycosyltransferase involved in cell wall biosynthesis
MKLAIRLGRKDRRGLPVHLIYLAEASLLHRKLCEAGVHHVHCHFGTNAAEVGMLCSELGGITFSFTVHGPEEFDCAFQLGLREKIARSRLVVAISKFGRGQLYRFASKDDWHKVKIVHCGLGDDFLESARSDPPAVPQLVSIGRFAEQKGQLALIEACRLLKERGIEFRLDLVGDGPMRLQIEEAIRAGGLEHRISLLGWQSGARIRELLKNARGLILPSFAEGLPVVIMEAMALARPVVTTYIAGIPELVRDGEEGFLVFASDVEGLADAIERLLQLDAQALAYMGSKAADRVRERHSIATEAAKLRDHLIEIGAI